MVAQSVQALQETGAGGEPQDFLQFFALVNREVQRPDEAQPQRRPPAHSLQARPSRSRRVAEVQLSALGLMRSPPVM